MSKESIRERRLVCPSCGKKAKRISPVTLRALLKDEFSGSFDTDEHSCCNSNSNGETGWQSVSEDTGWRFCGSQDCDIVYFAEDGGQSFAKSQLRVPVGVKEKTGERPLCYCFGHSVASITQELRTKGHSDAPDDIRAKMKNPGCQCETTNPSGSCCLGSVTRGIKIAREELKMQGAQIRDVESEVGRPTAVAPNSSTSRGEKIAKIGTLVSAMMASSCCWLPLLLLAMGVSGAGIASTLEAYRPVFIVVTFAFLAAAFYFTYRPRRVVAGGAHDCCSPQPAEGTEDCCATAGKGRFNMVALNKVMLWAVTALAVAFLLFPSYVGAFLGGGDKNTVTPAVTQAVLNVEGMTCEGCAALVEKAIRSVPGVLAVKVDYQKGQTVVGTEPCCAVPRDGILDALDKAGYTGSFRGPQANPGTSESQAFSCCPPLPAKGSPQHGK